MATLAVGASNVMNGKHASLDHTKRVATLDDKMLGSLLASEIVASAKMESNIWRGFAVRIMRLNTEAVAALLNAIKSDKGAMTKAQTEFGINDKLAKKRTNSATTRVSEMSTIAKAWQSGASIGGLMEYANKGVPAAQRMQSEDEVLAHLGYTVMLEYARTFTKSRAGRPAKSYSDKVLKFLDDNAPDEDDKAGVALREALVAVYNKLVGG